MIKLVFGLLGEFCFYKQFIISEIGYIRQGGVQEKEQFFKTAPAKWMMS
jgi:hypothetical protein